MLEKKNILTYEGLQSLESELHDLKVNKRKEVAQKLKRQGNRGTFPRMPSTMQQRMSKEISRLELMRLKNP